MLTIDLPFYLAIAAIGFGLSLITYRMFARRYEWPMGNWQMNHPSLPILIGLVSLFIGASFALVRWTDGAVFTSFAIAAFGVALAIFWTGFLRVGSQVSLVLAPVTAGLLTIVSMFGTQALEYHTVRSEIRELRQQLQDQFGLKKGDFIAPRDRQN